MVFINDEAREPRGRSALRDLAVVRCLCRRALYKAVSYDGRSSNSSA
ncbi:hypothetical protein ABT104_10740 [Streptomyces mobaraensis]